MPVRVVSCEVNAPTANIVLGAPTITELHGRAVEQVAIQEAVKNGLGSPGISSKNGPYPVDAAGESDQAVVTGAKATAEYRLDVKLMSAR